jgi:TetR/AcrR family transcriptional repressor of nem operon
MQMVRVSREQAAANRETLVDAAGRLFRVRGVDGVGVAEVAKEAGLTHGALYAHFPSKEMLAAEALKSGMQKSLSDVKASAGGAEPTLGGYLDFLLSRHMRDAMEGCPMTASGSEIARGSAEVSRSFAEGFENMVAALAAAAPPQLADDERRALAITAIAAELGAIVISRGILKSDPALADGVLDTVRARLGDVLGA